MQIRPNPSFSSGFVSVIHEESTTTRSHEDLVLLHKFKEAEKRRGDESERRLSCSTLIFIPVLKGAGNKSSLSL